VRELFALKKARAPKLPVVDWLSLAKEPLLPRK